MRNWLGLLLALLIAPCANAQAPMDSATAPEIVRSLLGANVDPNAKDSSGYTALARILFDPNRTVAVPKVPGAGHETRTYAKVDLVRALLDSGATPNMDHGGWGRNGALGLARREDTDVIALLIARGATLSSTTGGGPVATALEMDRDDLALALLKRDGVTPQDRLALTLAARRGWRPVVEALLQAGADPNAADGRGMTALGFAERRRDAAMMQALKAAGAQPVTKPARPLVRATGDFAAAVAYEIDDVVFLDPPRFALTDGKAPVFAFYGKAPTAYEQVSCERAASFEFIAYANLTGGLLAGICTAEARRVRDLAAQGQAGLEALLSQLLQGGLAVDRAKLEAVGWTYTKRTGPGGAEEHYYPLIFVGHGIMAVSTLVVVPRGGRKAIVVQAETSKLCDRGVKDQTPLCTDPRQALEDIAHRLQARFAD